MSLDYDFDQFLIGTKWAMPLGGEMVEVLRPGLLAGRVLELHKGDPLAVFGHENLVGLVVRHRTGQLAQLGGEGEVGVPAVVLEAGAENGEGHGNAPEE